MRLTIYASLAIKAVVLSFGAITSTPARAAAQRQIVSISASRFANSASTAANVPSG